ncbi:HpcH/HpaI aldolase/citrate lyase family protein [Chloroflexota bacterium]
MEKNVAYNFKKRLQAGEIVFGQTIGPGNDPGKTVQALKDFGFDFIIMDCEHSLLNKETVFEYIRASRKLDIPILLRPEEKNAFFRCYLDAGVNGLMVPQVNTVEEAIYVVEQSCFPPIGHRGSGIGLSPYLLDFQNPAEMPLLDMTEYINRNMILLPQTETLESISNLRRILSLDGITGTIVGIHDLTIDICGIPPKALRSELVTSDIVEEKLKQIAQICKETGKVAGLAGLAPKVLAKWAREGYQLFLLGYVIDGNVASLRPRIEEMKSLLSPG